MKIVLINPPHTAIGSRVPDDHLPPLGLAGGRRPADRRRPCRCGWSMPSSGRCRIDALVARGAARRTRLPCLSAIPARPPRIRPRLAIAEMIKARSPAYADHLWRRLPDLSLARRACGNRCLRLHRARRGRGDDRRTCRMRSNGALPLSDVAGIAYRDDLGRPFATATGPHDRRPRRLPRRLGADRPSPLQLLGRQARRRHAVLARLPASVQLLRPARLLDPLAASRSR